MDALTVAGKLAVAEDDTRTPFCEPGCVTTGCVPSINATVQLLRRNLLTSWLHGSSVYLYDMGGPSWGSYNTTENTTASKKLYSAVRGVNRAVARIVSRNSTKAGLAAEVAVFIPSTAQKARVYQMMWDHLDSDADAYTPTQFQLGNLGAPVRWFYLEQLPTLPDSALRDIKLAVLLSPAVISDALAAVIRTRLASRNRTLVYTYIAGLLTSTTANDFNISRAADITGFPQLTGHGSAAPIRTKLTAATTTGVGVPPAAPRWSPELVGSILDFRSWETHADGQGKGIPKYVRDWMPPNRTSPWFHVQEDSDVVVLGRFAGGGESDGRASVAWRDNGDHRVVYTCHTWLPRLAYRAIAVSAGVHMFVDGTDGLPPPMPCPKFGSNNPCGRCHRCGNDGPTCLGFGDVAEAAGPALMIHAGPTLMHGSDKVRTVRLPCAAESVRDERGALVCHECGSFETAPMEAGDVALFDVEIEC